MTTFTCAAPAKINLTLKVTGRRDDGYHLMDSLVTFAELSDFITLEFAETDHLAINGIYAESLNKTSVDDNIIMKAITAFRVKTGWSQHFSVILEKNIPVAAGVGGGSSNAAAMIKLLNDICPNPLSGSQLEDLALTLGADVPVCLKSYDHHLWRMRGIGEDLDQLHYASSSDLGLILINPGVTVPTAAVFKSLRDKTDQYGFAHKQTRDHSLSNQDFKNWLEDGNSLTEPAIDYQSAIGDALDQVQSLGSHDGFLTSGMSGSGATVFALFDAKADAIKAAATLQTDYWIWAGSIFNAD